MASAVVGNLKVLLTADTAAFDKAMKGADASTQKLAATMKRDLEPSQTRINKLVRDFAGSKEIGNAIAYAQAIEKAGGATKLTADQQARANKVLQEGADKLRALGPEYAKLNPAMAANIAKVNELAAATARSTQATTKMSGVMSSMRGVLGAFGVTLGAAGLINFGRSVFDSADKIVDLSAKMGVGVEAAQRFQFAARQSGAEIEDVTQAIVKMSDHLAEGDKSTVAALDKVGLKFADIRAMKPEEAFRAIADAIGKIPDPMQQAQVALELFGKGGAALLPMIREGSLKAADGINVMADETIKRLEAAKQSWDNFWNAIVIGSGEAIVGIADLDDAFGALFRRLNTWKGLGNFLSGMAGGVAKGIDPATLLVAQAFLSEGLETKRDITLPIEPGKTPKAKTKTELDADAKAAMNAAAAATKLREAIEKLTGKQLREDLAAFEKQFSGAMKAGGIHKTEVDATIKTIEKFILAGEDISPSMMSWFTSNAMAQVIGNNEKLQQSFLKTAISAQVLERQARTSMSGLINPTDWAGLLSGGMSVSDLMGQTNTKGPSLGQLFGRGLSGSVGNMDNVIMQAVMGGGNVPKSIGALFGSQVSGSMLGEMSSKGIFSSGTGKQWQGMFGNKVGGQIAGMAGGIGSAGLAKLMSDGGGKGMMGNIGSYAAAGMMFGPWGAAIGAGVGAIVGALKKGKNSTIKARDEFAKELNFGNLNELIDTLATSGPGGKALADMAARGIGKQDSAANQKWMKDVQTFLETQAQNTAKITEKLGEAQNALAKFGGSAPKSLRPLIDNLLKSTQLTKDQRAALEAMGKAPSWQTIQQRAEALGIDMGALGGTFNQKRLADAGFSLFHDIEMFLEQGADQDGILRGMADELSALAMEAVKTGRALPKVLEIYMRRLQEMNLLVDEQGNAIMEGLVFQEMADESLQQVVSVLEEIRDLLAGPPVAPSPPRGESGDGGGVQNPDPPKRFFGGFREPGIGDVGDGGINLPSFAGGTHGKYMDFGPGTPVMLHGKERVTTESESLNGSVININAIDAASFEQFLRRGGADVIARRLPDASGRYVGRRI